MRGAPPRPSVKLPVNAMAIPWWPLTLLAYPLVVHVGVLRGVPGAGLLTLLVIAAVMLLPALRQRAVAAWTGLILGACAAVLAIAGGHALALLYLPPVVITFMLLCLFGGSLQGSRTPVVTAIALRMGESPSPELYRYTRSVTRAWTIVFALLLVESTLLALFAPPGIWSLFTNIINYCVVGVFFAGEFWLRRFYLPVQRYPNFVGFLFALRASVFSGGRNSRHDCAG